MALDSIAFSLSIWIGRHQVPHQLENLTSHVLASKEWKILWHVCTGPLARFVDLYDYICVFIAYNPHLLLVMNQQYILCGCSASFDSRLFFCTFTSTGLLMSRQLENVPSAPIPIWSIDNFQADWLNSLNCPLLFPAKSELYIPHCGMPCLRTQLYCGYLMKRVLVLNSRLL